MQPRPASKPTAPGHRGTIDGDTGRRLMLGPIVAIGALSMCSAHSTYVIGYSASRHLRPARKPQRQFSEGVHIHNILWHVKL